MITIPLYEPSEIAKEQLDLSIDFITEIREWCEQASSTFDHVDRSHKYFGEHQDALYFHDEVSIAIDNATGYRPTHYWMQFYAWNDHMSVHAHRDEGNQIVRSGILFLDDIGVTTFICDPGPDLRENTIIASEPGMVVTFPRDMLHYVIPHCVIGKMRYTLPFNCVVK